MAMASVSCASGDSEPRLMPPVVKRLTISAAGSTSSSGIGSRSPRQLQQAAQHPVAGVLLVDQRAKCS